MVEIVLPNETPKVIRANIGDLMLVISPNRDKTHTLGTLNSLRNSERWRDKREFCLEYLCLLRPCIEIGGVSIPTAIKEEREYAIFLLRRGMEIYRGKKDIIDKLKSEKEFELYAKIIASMKAPYIR